MNIAKNQIDRELRNNVGYVQKEIQFYVMRIQSPIISLGPAI